MLYAEFFNDQEQNDRLHSKGMWNKVWKGLEEKKEKWFWMLVRSQLILKLIILYTESLSSSDLTQQEILFLSECELDVVSFRSNIIFHSNTNLYFINNF